MTRLIETLPGFELVDAREHHALVVQHRAAGRDINDGMIPAINGTFYHGAAALNAIALFSNPVRAANRIDAGLRREPRQVARPRRRGYLQV